MLDVTAVTRALESVSLSYALYQKTCSLLEPAFGRLVETPVTDALASLVDQHIVSINALIGDTEDSWVGWFVWDVQCGAHPMEAIIDKVPYMIDSPAKMAELLVLWESRA